MSDIDDIDDEVAKPLVPNLTSVLLEGGRRGRTRGLAGYTIRPVSSAVVIGLGGTGVQTVARVRSAVESERIDRAAHEAVRFLAIDAAGDQNPPLPPGVGLGPDLVNLQGFNAASYLDGQKPNDPFLRSWWDDGYRVPRGPLNEGMRRERMLGRLCFHQDATLIRTRIASAVSEAAKVRAEHIAAGNPGNAGFEMPIYLVSSCAGGTGSSGFLETVMAIHAAMRDLGNVVPKIRAFVLLPGVFSQVVSEDERAAHRANAYAFFKELDHFLVKSSDFPKMMGMPHIRMNDGDLLHQVFVLDASVGRSGVLNNVTDIFEVVAESIYQFLFTQMGRSIIGVDGANTERILGDQDDFGKSRRYCSLGLARIVLPGDTLRMHLVSWWCDWVVRQAVLRAPSDTDITALRDSKQLTALVDGVDALTSRAAAGEFDDDVRSFLDRGREAPRALEAQHDLASADELLTDLRRSASAVATEVRVVLESLRPRLVNALDHLVESSAFADDANVPLALELVRLLEKGARQRLAGATDALNARIAAKDRSAKTIDERLDRLAEAESRNLMERAGAAVTGLFNDEVLSAAEAAESVGRAIKDWTQAIYDAELAQAQRDFLQAACRRLERLRLELESAEERLNRLARRARARWVDDELIGKDAGPKETTVLVPSDTQPEVESSALTRSLRLAIADEHRGFLADDSMHDFLGRWIAESLTRGFFDLGSEDRITADRAESTLLASLEREAFERALQRGTDDGPVPRMPETLPAAAAVVGEEERLATSVVGVADLSRNVCWSWEAGRFHLPSAAGQERRADLRPAVTTVVAAHRSMDDYLDEAFQPAQRTDLPDPERVVVMSCEWGVPIHCLPVTSEWKTQYDLLAARRERQRIEDSPAGVEPPSHIDRRFEAFADLVPEYFRAEEAAPRLARALVIALALVDDETSEATRACYFRDATRPAISPVRQERRLGFVGRVVSLDDGQLRPAPESSDIVFGTSWAETLRGVGLDVTLGESIDTCWQVVVEAVDPSELIRLIDLVTKNKVEAGLARRRLTTADREVFQHLLNAYEDLRDDLEQYV